jgi:hypothetical protein
MPPKRLPPPTPSSELADVIRSSHAFFDSSRSGRVSLPEFGDVLRGAGFCPTEAELSALLTKVEPVYGSRLSVDVCILIASTLAESRFAAPPERELVSAALEEFERLRSPRDPPLPAGVLSLSDVHALLTGHCDRLTQGEFGALLSRLPPSLSGPARIDTSALLDATLGEQKK